MEQHTMKWPRVVHCRGKACYTEAQLIMQPDELLKQINQREVIRAFKSLNVLQATTGSESSNIFYRALKTRSEAHHLGDTVNAGSPA